MAASVSLLTPDSAIRFPHSPVLLERTQRRLFRALFLLGCVLPTLATAGWAVSRVRPAFVERQLAQATNGLGATVTCDRFLTPRPDRYELHGVSLGRGRDSDAFLRCDRVTVAQIDGSWRFRLGTVEIVEAREAGAWLLRLLERPLVAQGVCEAVLADGGSSNLLDDFAIKIGANAADERSLLARERDGEAVLKLIATDSGYAFETRTSRNGFNAEWLPARPFRGLAEQIRFIGDVHGRIDRRSDRANAHAVGELNVENVGVGGLTSKVGSFSIEDMAWTGDRIDRLHGRLDLRDGSLTRELVWGLHERLSAEAWDRMRELYQENSDVYLFTQLACEVELDDRGLTLVGGCGEIDGQQRGGPIAHSIVEHQGEPLLREPRERPMPAVKLLQAWWPGESREVPVAPAALLAAPRLPAPVASRTAVEASAD